jgi:hypothetical protein
VGWSTILLKPGLNVEITPTQNQAGYAMTQLGRYKAGLFQKMGGWTKFFPTKIDGVPKTAHTWRDLAGANHLSIGTTTDLDVITSGVYQDVCPQVLTTNPAVNFATTLNSNLVTVVDTLVNNITNYDAVFFNTPVSVGGIILSGLYQITANIAANSYQFAAQSNATATVVAPGGAVPSFTTVSGSANVTVTFAGHGLQAGYDIVFPIATTLNGVTISGRYVAQSITDANNFVITVINAASASTLTPVPMNAGNAQFLYYIAIGPQALAGAYGAGPYGAGPYGIGTAISGQTGADIQATDWSLDNWGELLLSNPENGPLFYWGPSSGFVNSQIVPQAPAFNTGMFVSTNQQFVIAYGSTSSAAIGVYQDPLLIKWCDANNFFNWTLSPTTQSGSWRLSSGSRIVGGASTQLRNLIWTDKDLWVSSYIGSTLVFNMVKTAEGAGMIAKHAWGKLGEAVYWMGKKNIWKYDNNGPHIVPCPVWDAIFQDMDLNNIAKCHVGVNKSFSEIMFFWPSKSGNLGYCDKMAKFNIEEGAWDLSNIQRSVWKDSDTFDYPVAMTNDGFVYSHENGFDADGNVLNPYFESGFFYVANGQQKVFIDRIYPDFKWGEFNGTQNANLLFTLKTIEEMGQTVPDVYGPYLVNQNSKWIEPRVRARQVSVRIESQDQGSFWRLGAVRFRYSPDGSSGGRNSG